MHDPTILQWLQTNNGTCTVCFSFIKAVHLGISLQQFVLGPHHNSVSWDLIIAGKQDSSILHVGHDRLWWH